MSGAGGGGAGAGGGSSAGLTLLCLNCNTRRPLHYYRRRNATPGSRLARVTTRTCAICRGFTPSDPNTAQNVNVNNNPPAPPPNPPPRSPPPGSSSSSDDSDSDFVYDNTRRRVRRRHPHSDPDDSGDSVFGDDTRNLGLRQLTQYMADSDFFDGDVSRVPEESDWILTGMGVVLYFIGWASILTLFAVIVVF